MLRLLASELDGPAIARELVVSLNTVRTHTKNIYAKLGVTSRRAAVARAHQLNLVPHGRTLTGHLSGIDVHRLRTSPPISPLDVIRPHHIGS